MKKQETARGIRRRDARATTAEVLNMLGSAYLRERVHEVFDDLVCAVLDAAIGVRHVYAKDPTTQQWRQVTDPDVIAALLNTHSLESNHILVLTTEDGDARLLEALLAFQLGAPFDSELLPALTRALLVDTATGSLPPVTDPALSARIRQHRAGREFDKGLRAENENGGGAAFFDTPHPDDPTRVH